MKRVFFTAFIAALLIAHSSPSVAAANSAGGSAAKQETMRQQGDDARQPMTPQERAQRTEERIKELHDELGITSTQETRWEEVARTMRDNQATISSLIDDRNKNAASMDALDDLQSYADITQAHADGIKRMLAAFEPLYAQMSESQKKRADSTFHSFRGRRMGGRNGN